MAQTKQQIQALLAHASSHPRHRFGQNFMIDQNLVRIVADAGQIEPDDLVIEVGPGTGTLTEELLARGADVLGVEIDRDLARLLREKFVGDAGFNLIEGDALAGKHAIHPELAAAVADAQRAGRAVRLVANLPYNIASPLIIELLKARVQTLVFTVQKEVADRIAAAPGSSQYGTISILVQLMAKVEILRTLPPQAFWPMPKISSALVRLDRADRLGDSAAEFSRFLQTLFSARRKTVQKTLTQTTSGAGQVLAALSISPQARPENLSPEQCLALFQSVKSITSPASAPP